MVKLRFFTINKVKGVKNSVKGRKPWIHNLDNCSFHLIDHWFQSICTKCIHIWFLYFSFLEPVFFLSYKLYPNKRKGCN